MQVCPQEVLCNDSSEKPHHSDIHPICPVIAEHLLCLVHEPEDFGGWQHLLETDSLCITIRKKPLAFLTRASGFHLLKQCF